MRWQENKEEHKEQGVSISTQHRVGWASTRSGHSESGSNSHQ